MARTYDKIPVKRFDYTYIVRYKYREEDAEQIGYYCFDVNHYPTDDELKEHFGIEEGDEFEVVNDWANNFNCDDSLSDEVITVLQGRLKDEKGAKGYADYSFAYIAYIVNELRYHKEELEAYRKDVLTSLLGQMDLRRRNRWASYAIEQIMHLFDIKRNPQLTERKQLEQMLKVDYKDEILRKLVKPQEVTKMKKKLEKLYEAYRLCEEKSAYRIGVLFLRFFYESLLWLPKFHDTDKPLKNGKKPIKNLSEYMRLMTRYFGLDIEINYREDKLRSYKPDGATASLFNTIKSEHYEVWSMNP